MNKKAHSIRTQVLIRWLAVHTDKTLEEIAEIMGCSPHSAFTYAAGVRERNGFLSYGARRERRRCERKRLEHSLSS